MFDLFRNRTTKELLEEAKESYMVQEFAPEDTATDALYMVGNDSAGRVQLRVGYSTSITLTLNAASVRHLIRQLEAAIMEEDTTENL